MHATWVFVPFLAHPAHGKLTALHLALCPGVSCGHHQELLFAKMSTEHKVRAAAYAWTFHTPFPL